MKYVLPYKSEVNREINDFNDSPLHPEWACEMDRRNNLDYVDFLQSKKVIEEREAQTLRSMIASSDRENYEMAKVILTEKTKELR
jgi:hypothetical protein